MLVFAISVFDNVGHRSVWGGVDGGVREGGDIEVKDVEGGGGNFWNFLRTATPSEVINFLDTLSFSFVLSVSLFRSLIYAVPPFFPEVVLAREFIGINWNDKYDTV